MQTFFSGEDNDELRRNTHLGEDSYYFSLIVNNVLDLSARLTKRIKNTVIDPLMGDISIEVIGYYDFTGKVENAQGLSKFQLERFDTLNKQRIASLPVRSFPTTNKSVFNATDESEKVGVKTAMAWCIALDERVNSIEEAIQYQVEDLATPEDIAFLKEDYDENLQVYIEEYKLQENDILILNEFSTNPEFVQLFKKQWEKTWKIINQDSKMQNGLITKSQF